VDHRFHVAQNDGTVSGSGSHDKTGRHCPAIDPNGKLDIVRAAGAWMRDDAGHRIAPSSTLLGRLHVPDAVMLDPKIWKRRLARHDRVRNAHDGTDG